MGIAAAVQTPSSCRASDEAELNEEGFDDVLDRVARLGKACRQSLDADRSAAIEIGDHGQIAPVHGVEAEAVDLQPVEGAVGDAGVDGVRARGVREVADPAQQASGDAWRSARSPGNLMLAFAGGGAGLFSALIAGWVNGDRGSKPVALAVRY